jgi:beta-glucosidase/6-phospho-beta-glucosidase/beta-galactosidase
VARPFTAVLIAACSQTMNTGKTPSQRVYRDVSDDHYQRYQDDARSMKALAAAAYRFSIS